MNANNANVQFYELFATLTLRVALKADMNLNVHSVTW
jgi:hypothetical protein